MTLIIVQRYEATVKTIHNSESYYFHDNKSIFITAINKHSSVNKSLKRNTCHTRYIKRNNEEFEFEFQLIVWQTISTYCSINCLIKHSIKFNIVNSLDFMQYILLQNDRGTLRVFLLNIFIIFVCVFLKKFISKVKYGLPTLHFCLLFYGCYIKLLMFVTGF